MHTPPLESRRSSKSPQSKEVHPVVRPDSARKDRINSKSKHEIQIIVLKLVLGISIPSSQHQSQPKQQPQTVEVHVNNGNKTDRNTNEFFVKNLDDLNTVKASLKTESALR